MSFKWQMPPSPLFKLSYTFKLKRNLFTAKIFHFRCEAKLTFMLFFIFTKEKKPMNFQIYLFKLKELKYFQIFVYYYTVTCNRLKYRITTNTGAFSIGLTSCFHKNVCDAVFRFISRWTKKIYCQCLKFNFKHK